MKQIIIGFVIVLLILISGFSCRNVGNSGEDTTYQHYNYQVPENIGDGWQTGSLEDGSTQNYHGPLIHFNRNTPHNLHSATKSITSTLLGIAINHGFIAGVEERV